MVCERTQNINVAVFRHSWLSHGVNGPAIPARCECHIRSRASAWRMSAAKCDTSPVYLYRRRARHSSWPPATDLPRYGDVVFLPLRASIEKREDGKTYCQPHSYSVLENFRASACG